MPRTEPRVRQAASTKGARYFGALYLFVCTLSLGCAGSNANVDASVDDSGAGEPLPVGGDAGLGADPDAGSSLPVADASDTGSDLDACDEDSEDLDSDGTCDALDTDDDNDGVADAIDPAPRSPDLCGDRDGDTCDDCSVGADGFGSLPDADPDNDGDDRDGDGICDRGDTIECGTPGGPACPEVRTLAVVRVSMTEGESREVFYTSEEIRQQLFESELSLTRQYEKCSNGAISFSSAGIHDVTVEGSTSDYESASEIRNRALKIFAEDNQVKSAEELADHVMVIIPDNDFPGFVGNAGTNSWILTVNDVWSLDVGVYMHEIGHNLGLGHASVYAYGEQGLGDSRTGWDYTSYMSATGWEPRLDEPSKCFNAAEMAQLGWYADRTRVVEPPRGTAEIVRILGFSAAAESRDEAVLVQVGKYTILYNLAHGFNAGTELFADAVTVSFRDPKTGGTGTAGVALVPSTETKEGAYFVDKNFNDRGEALVVRACRRISGRVGTSQAIMEIAVGVGVDAHTICPRPSAP